ncbi:hypothetical protein V8E54_000799 [Elaphomyces granulatus]
MEAFRPGSSINQVQQPDLAGSGFLRLLRVLRTVVLQDSASLRPLFPRHPMWKATVFSSEAYQAFSAKVAAASEEPKDLQIKKVLPILLDRVNMLREEVQQARQELKAVFAEVRELKVAVHNLSSGKRSVTVGTDSSNPPTHGTMGDDLLNSHRIICKHKHIKLGWLQIEGFEFPLNLPEGYYIDLITDWYATSSPDSYP